MQVRWYDFGPFRVDLVTRLLICDGVPVSLTPKAFDILVLLIRGRGHIVDKETLIDEIWRGAVIEESNIPRNISMLRKALHDGPGLNRYIVTVPGRGYQFAGDVTEGVVEEMSPVAGDADVKGAPPHGRPHASLARGIVFAAIFVTVAAAAVAYAIRRTGGKPEEPVAPSHFWQLTFSSGLQGEPTWSPDGKMIAYSSDRNGKLDVWVQSTDGGDPLQVTKSAAHDWEPDWSKDGRLAFRSERSGGGLFVIPAFGGAEQQVAPFGYHPRWSPDGTQLLFQGSNVHRFLRGSMELYTVSVDARPPQKVLPGFLAQFASYTAAWHPDSRRISVWGTHAREGLTFWTASLDGNPPIKSELTDEVRHQFSESGVSFRDADGVPLPFLWSPAGDALYFEGVSQGVHNLWRVPVDASTIRWKAAPQRLTTSADLNEGISLTRDGRKLAVAVRNERIRLWSFPRDPDSGRVVDQGKPITASAFDALSPVLSRDGTRLVYEVERGGRQEVWVRSLVDERDSQVIAGDRYTRVSPIWSDDDTRIAYVRSGNGTDRVGAESAVVSMAASGGREQPLQTPAPVARLFDWSADGRWVLASLQQRTTQGYQLAIVPVGGRPTSDIRVIATDPDSNVWKARLAPDQRWVAFTRATGPGVSAVYVVPVAGGEPIRITSGEFFDDRPRWSPDSRMIYFLSNRSGFFNLWARRFDPPLGQPVEEAFAVTRFDSPARVIPSRMVQVGVAVARDKVIIPLSETSGNIWVLETPRTDKR